VILLVVSAASLAADDAADSTKFKRAARGRRVDQVNSRDPTPFSQNGLILVA
jgi:hypothetical protein